MCVIRWLLLAFSVNIGAIGECRHTSDIQRHVSPVSFFGFRKDASPVVGVIQTLSVTSPEELHCPTQLTVRVHKAILDVLEDNGVAQSSPMSHICSETLRSKCLDHRSCSVAISDCTSVDKTNIIGPSFKRMFLQYSCELSNTPQPLYDGKLFFEGVSQQFLMIPGSDESSQPKRGDRALQRSLKRCLDSESCRYVTCHDAQLHSGDFNAAANSVCMFVKPDTFRLAGYSVYPNFTGLCTRPKYIHSQDFYEVAKNARSMAHGSFTIAYERTNQFGLDKKYSAWICRGIPTIVPMVGHVVAIPASGHNRNREMPRT
ncbi:hypothetical protein BaOVIS_018900 [Babesia ovis]|uniref:Uncharacterized protein n=1 Tax=Babesia ovis TaxID=5869 RepID=A0A9W5TBU7_BABOV|nr:hypothetical protein BaOVIS_018900 [Babesia ovis]